ncbi:MAG: leucine-rich repeat protein [Ruminococcus sp.]|nr:leucine-rich repeat protein [Ruminococcus sp.]
MTIVKTLKALYERLGGTPSDVADTTRAVDVLNAIAALYGGASNATHIAKAIANIVAVASGLIKPSGTKSITANGSNIDVKEYAAVNVAVPQPSGTISITENGSDIDVAQYASANVSVPTYAEDYAKMIDRSITNVEIPESVSQIGYYAFAGCRNITSITFPSTVAFAANSVCQDCTSLSNVTFLGTNFYRLGDFFFKGCTSLTSVSLPSQIMTLGNAAFANSGLTSIALPDGMNELDSELCENCTDLETVVFPANMTDAGSTTFKGCSSLNNLSFPNSLRYIGISTFEGCTSLTSAVLRDTNLTRIGERAFYGCTSLTTVYLPGSVTQIKADAFTNSGLTDIYYIGNQQEWEAITGLAGAGIPQGCTIHYNSYGNE